AGAGALCVLEGGVLKSYALGRAGEMQKVAKGELAFVQISDSHMGFDKPANTDVIGTFKAAIDKINALPMEPEFILHTGDISHLAKPAENEFRFHGRSEEHTSELQSQSNLVCRLLLEKKKLISFSFSQ